MVCYGVLSNNINKIVDDRRRGAPKLGESGGVQTPENKIYSRLKSAPFSEISLDPAPNLWHDATWRLMEGPMINDILEQIKGTFGPLTYNSIHTLLHQWPPEIVDRLDYGTVEFLAWRLSDVLGEA